MRFVTDPNIRPSIGLRAKAVTIPEGFIGETSKFPTVG